MKIFAGGRASGKTTALRDWAMEDPANRGIVITNYNQWDYWRDFRAAGGVTVDDVQASLHTRGRNTVFGVDDVENIICNQLSLSPDRLGAITLPGELIEIDARRMYRELQEIRSSCQ